MDDFIIHTGSVVQEYLEARGISQKEAASAMGITAKHLSNIIRGKAALTAPVAIALESVIKDVSASYWINYEGRYQEYKARCEEYANVSSCDLSKLSKRFHFKEIFGKTNLSVSEQAVLFLRMFGIKRFEDFSLSFQNAAAFLEDGGNREAIEVWLRLGMKEMALQDTTDLPDFDPEALERCLPMLRCISMSSDTEQSLEDCRYVLNSCGVLLTHNEVMTESKVRGASLYHEGRPAIFYTKRFKYHDQIWFAIAHEIGHIMGGHIVQDRAIVSTEEDDISSDAKESEANFFARRLFLSDDEYALAKEVALSVKENLIGSELRKLAAKYEVHPGILAGRLAHDKVVEYRQVAELRK